MLNLFLVNLLYRIGQVIIQINPKWTDKDYVSSDRNICIVRQAKAIIEHHLANIKIFRIFESVAIETFDEYSLTIIPQRKGVIGCYDSDPLFFRMQSHQFDLIRGINIKVKQDFVLACHT